MEPVTDDAEVPQPRPPQRSRQIIQGIISLALVVSIFVFVLPHVADFSKVWGYIRAMTPAEIAVLMVFALWNLVSYALVWVACMPGLTVAQGTVASEASTAVANTVPGGGYLSIGLSYTMFRSWGFRRSIVTLALLITGIWNNFAKLVLPVVALVFVAAQGNASASRMTAAGAGVGGLVLALTIFTVVLRSEALAVQIGNMTARFVNWLLRPLKRPPAAGWDIAVTRFRDKTIDLVRARWHWMTLATIVSHVSLYLVLLLSLRFVGVSESDVGWAEVLAAFSFARLVTAIPLTPGGVGVVELALTGTLVAAGGERPQVVAGVLVYRVLTYLLPIPVGVLCYAFWRRNRSWRRDTVPSPIQAPAAT
jgi:uncharacterized membrane protein YbhN (UPF0104 family)